SSSLYYVITIGYATWFLGPTAGIVFALLSSAAWLDAYILVGEPFSRPGILVWNLLAETAIYAAIVFGVGALRDRVRHARRLADRLFTANQALDRETNAVGELQRKLLPQAPPRLPGYAWSLYYETSTRAGGDYYDFIA